MLTGHQISIVCGYADCEDIVCEYAFACSTNAVPPNGFNAPPNGFNEPSSAVNEPPFGFNAPPSAVNAPSGAADIAEIKAIAKNAAAKRKFLFLAPPFLSLILLFSLPCSLPLILPPS